MPYTTPFVYMTINGIFSAPTVELEQWKVGVKIPCSPAPSGAQLLAFLTDVAPAVSTFHSAPNMSVGQTPKLTFLTAAHLGTDGRYTGGGAQTTTTYNYPSPVSGIGTTAAPLSQAIVLSLRTQFARGLASHGRLYWPWTGPGIQTDGTIGVSDALAKANLAKTLLDAINSTAAANLGTSNHVSVMSKVGAGQTAPVTKVLVGVLADRQERRQKNQSENYQTATLATTLSIVETLGDTPVDKLPGGVGVRPRR